MKENSFIQKNKAKLIIVGIVLVIAVVSFVLYFNQAVVDEKYCDGITIGCYRSLSSGCINSLNEQDNWAINDEKTCYCNTTENVCELISMPISNSVCHSNKDCAVGEYKIKCLTESASSTEGVCSSVSEGCNYYMVDGKAKRQCYEMEPINKYS